MVQNNISRLPLKEIHYKNGIIEDDFFAKLKEDSLYYIPHKTWESLFLFCKDSQEIFLVQIDDTYSNGDKSLNEVRLYYYTHKAPKNQSDMEFWDGFIFEKSGAKQSNKKIQERAAEIYMEFLQKRKSSDINAYTNNISMYIDEMWAGETFIKKMDIYLDVEKTKKEITTSVNKGKKNLIKAIKL